MASLGPIAAELFAEKAQIAKVSGSAVADKASYEKICDVCQKSYYSHNSFENHLVSKRHRQNVTTASRQETTPPENQCQNSRLALKRGVKAASQQSGAPVPEVNAVNDVIRRLEAHKLEGSMRHGRQSSASTASINEMRDEDTKHHISSITPVSKQAEAAALDKVLERCLFCNYMSPSMKLSLLHMSKIHGMFVPEQDFLVDLKGLVRYLDQKVRILHECLKCGKGRDTAEGIQTHMRDKSHCMIGFENEEQQIEIGQFYDFRSSYSDDEEDEDEEEDQVDLKAGRPEKITTGFMLGGTRAVKVETLTPDESDGDAGGAKHTDQAGWETDSSAESEEVGHLRMDHDNLRDRLHKHVHHSHTSHELRSHRNADGFHSHAHHPKHAVFYADNELHLPSGRTVGHRSMNKYYRQYFSSDPVDTHRQRRGSSNERSAHATERGRNRAPVSRANGGQGMTGVTSSIKKQVTGVEKIQRKQQVRQQATKLWRNNKQSNMQKHFRVSDSDSCLRVVTMTDRRITGPSTTMMGDSKRFRRSIYAND